MIAAWFFKDSFGGLNFGGSGCPDGRSEQSEGVCSSIYGYKKVGIVFGNTQNVPLLKDDLSNSGDGTIGNVIGDAFYASSNSSTNIKLYSVSNPNTTIDTKNKLRGTAKNLNASRKNLNHNFSTIKNATNSEPLNDGADYLGSIIRAAKENKSEKTAIIIIGSGLSDNGFLNFAQDSLIEKYSKGELSISAKMEQSGYNRDLLSNTDVYWINIGDTVSPQIELSVPAKGYLGNIYKEALLYLGANSVKFDNITPSTDSIKTNKTVKTTEIGELGKRLGETVAKFEAEKATMIPDEEKKARAWLSKNVVGKMEKIQVIGYIDAEKNNCPEVSNKLSLDRANTIKRMLISMGMSENSIRVEGYAAHPPRAGSTEDYSCETPESPNNRTVMIKRDWVL